MLPKQRKIDQFPLTICGREYYRKCAVSRARKQLYAFEEKKCSEQVYLKVLKDHTICGKRKLPLKCAVSRTRKQLYTFEEKKCSEQVYLKVLEAHVN